MRSNLIAIGWLLAGTVLFSQEGSDLKWLEAGSAVVIQAGNRQIPVIDFQGLKPLFQQEDSEVHVINFWATWCAPCVKELPYFERIAIAYANKGVEVTLVSLDFPSMWEKRLPAFLEKQSIQAPVVVLDDPDQNTWIPEVSPDWSGAIPATLIYTSGRREFYEKTFEAAELEALIESFLND